MTPDTLHDALSLLPQDLLIPVDRLRQKKRVHWKSVAALAACLCLVVGLWFLNPQSKVATDSANGKGEMPEYEPMETHQFSTTASGIAVKVLRAEENHLVVAPKQPEKLSDENISLQLPSLQLTFENLEQIPQVQAGQTIRIYFEPEQLDEYSMTVKPYKIEIVKEDTQ